MTISEKNFRLINAFIGMCFPIVGWNDCLYQLGYRIVAIEFPFKNSEGEEIKPEVILTSFQLNHSLLMESKAGGIEDDQIARYEGIQLEDLAQRASITIPDTATFSFDVFILCNEDNNKKVILGLSKLSSNLPVISLTHKQLERLDYVFIKTSGKFNKDEIDKIFTEGVTLPDKYPPRNLIPFLTDPEFPDHVIVKYILKTLISYMKQDKGRVFEVLTILSKAIPYNLFDCYHTEEKKRLVDKSTNILTNLTKDSVIGQYVARLGAGRNPAKFQIVKSPEDEAPSEKTRLYQRLSDRASEIVLKRKAEGLSSLQLEFEDFIDESTEPE